MRQNKYLPIFNLIRKKPEGVTFEIEESSLSSWKSNLSRLKKVYNDGEEKLMEEFRTGIITANFKYTVQKDVEPSSPDKIVVTISLEEPEPLAFKIIGIEE